MKAIFIDFKKCVGCRVCELVCSFYHFKTFKESLSAIRVLKYDFLSRDVPLVCQQCDDAYCKKACVRNAIRFNSLTGGYEIEFEKCIGCKMCVLACPFGVISYDDEEKKVVKCDLCNGKPQCIEICPSEAISYIEVSDFVIDKKRRYIQEILSGIKS